MLARPAGQPLQIERRETHVLGLQPAARVEYLQDGEADELLGLEVVLRPGAGRDQTPPFLLPTCVEHVVFGALLGITQDLIGLADQPETAVAARFGVVGVKSLRQQAVHAMNRLGLRVRADLKGLVVVGGLIGRHVVRSLILLSDRALPICKADRQSAQPGDAWPPGAGISGVDATPARRFKVRDQAPRISFRARETGVYLRCCSELQ